MALLHHVVCSGGTDSKLSNFAVSYGYIGSDHRPLSVTKSDVVLNNTANDCQHNGADHVVRDWSKVNNRVASEFASALDELLLNITLPGYHRLLLLSYSPIYQ